MKAKIYIIGSLRNPLVTSLSAELRRRQFDVFDDWFAAGPTADDSWQAYEQNRGRSYAEALEGDAASHVFEFDYHHLSEADAAVMVMPAGKSAHLELGFMIGSKKPGYILLDKEPERWDVMYRFATAVCLTTEELLARMERTY